VSTPEPFPKIRQEVQAVVTAVENRTGLRSRWNGQLNVVDQATADFLSHQRFNAKKEWSCGITVVEGITEDDRRWRTLIHEALHSVSVGLTESDYSRYRGWEEGIVEWLQRCYRPDVLRSLHVRISEAFFVELEKDWLYEPYIDALERIAGQIAEVPAQMFFEKLLQTPLKERAAFVLSWGLKEAVDAAKFKRVFAEASGKLRG